MNKEQSLLNKIRELGLTITSGLRSPAKNKAVGGSPTSYHLLGQAYDIVGEKRKIDQLEKWAKDNNYVEVLWQTAGHYDHIHIAWKDSAGGNTVRKGDTAPVIRTIQKMLGINVDGIYGPKTEQAIKNFQTSNGLLTDGVVGKETWSNLTLQGKSSFFY